MMTTTIAWKGAMFRRLCCRCAAAISSHLRRAPQCPQYSTFVDEKPYKSVPRFSRLLSPPNEALSMAERVMAHLQAVYDASDDQCYELLRSPTLTAVPEEQLLATISALKRLDIPLQQLLRIPWVLTIAKSELEYRLKLLTIGPNMFLSATDSIGFCCYCVSSITKYVAMFRKEASQVEGFRNRVYYTAHLLNVGVPELTEALVLPKSLFIMSVWRMSLVIKLIHEYNVPGEKIIQDPWMFLNGLKISAVDAKKKLPQNRKKSTRSNASNLEEKIVFLAQKLDIHVSLLKAHWRDPKFRKMLSRRGFARLNILLDEGYTLSEIMMTINVLGTSEQRLTERLAIFRKANHKTMKLNLLFHSDNLFEDYCSKVVFAPCLLDQLGDQARRKKTDLRETDTCSSKKWVYNDCLVEN